MLKVTNLVYSNVKCGNGSCRIVQLSDLHDSCFGKKQQRLIKTVAEQNPDIIVITGDLIDRNRLNITRSMDFVEGMKGNIPIYYVSGNHEKAADKEFIELKECLKSAGVTILDNKKVVANLGKIKLVIGGIPDLTVCKERHEKTTIEEFFAVEEAIKKLNFAKEDFNILLSHRPELFEIYAKFPVDLVFCGHAHGGQFRLPFSTSTRGRIVKKAIPTGLFSPGQGLFPQYTHGGYQKGNVTMVVSRGLGNSVFPLRIFNSREIVTLDLKLQQRR